MRSDEIVQMQIQILEGTLCAHGQDPKGCNKGVEAWWDKIAQVLFNDAAVKPICDGLSEGKCGAFRYFFVLNFCSVISSK